jgi:hypothetical protein
VQAEHTPSMPAGQAIASGAIEATRERLTLSPRQSRLKSVMFEVADKL